MHKNITINFTLKSIKHFHFKSESDHDNANLLNVRFGIHDEFQKRFHPHSPSFLTDMLKVDGLF